MDVLEIDAASNTGIDNVRDVIIDGINIIPARDRYKVFIIDEVHQLSKPAFNALLKTLEEPPSNVVFIMATTELHKVPDTILSRTQQFEFRTIPLQKILDRLKIIAKAEKINASDDALREIARSGEGSMRDAQSNFDQVISFAGDKIEVGDVANALGLASVDMMTRILDAIGESKPSQVLSVVEELSARGQDFRNFCRDLLGLIRDLLVTKVGGDGELCETSMLSQTDLVKRANAFGESDLVRFFHSLADTESRLKDAAQPRYMLEIGLVKLVEMRRLASVESIIERLGQLESSLDTQTTRPRAAAATQQQPASQAVEEKKTLKSEPSLDEQPAPASVPQKPASVVVEPDNTTASDLAFIKSLPVRLPPIASEELEHVEDQWLDDAYERKLLFSGDSLAPILSVRPFVAALVVEPSNGSQTPVVAATTASSSSTAAVAMALSETVEVVNSPEIDLPKLSENPSEQELTTYANAHPAVRNALKVFRGKIVRVSRT
jgi:DNA polymerase-3 subunit gamma/tau